MPSPPPTTWMTSCRTECFVWWMLILGNKWCNAFEFFMHCAIEKCFYWLVLIAVLFLNRLLTTSISVYRGYSSILEYAAAGCITGALYKFNMGLAGMAVGGGLGTDNFLTAYVIHIGRVHQVLSPLALKIFMLLECSKMLLCIRGWEFNFCHADSPNSVDNINTMGCWALHYK